MKPSEPITIDRSLIGIAAFQRNSWNLLLLQGTGERARVLSASSYASIGEVTEALHAAKGADLRIMHPTSATIVKVVRLPMVAASQMKQALKLQAEGMLLGATPACRVGLAPIPDVLGLDERQGLILVWPESAAGIVDRGIPSTAQFIPEPAALLPFITSDAPALIADRASGTVLLGLRGDNGMTLRSTRENTTDDAAWRASVRGSLLESLLNAGRDPATAAKEADRVLADAIETQCVHPRDRRFERVLAASTQPSDHSDQYMRTTQRHRAATPRTRNFDSRRRGRSTRRRRALE